MAGRTPGATIPVTVDDAFASALTHAVCGGGSDPVGTLDTLAAARGHRVLPAGAARELEDRQDGALLAELRRALNALPEAPDDEFRGLPVQLLIAIRVDDDSVPLAIVAARRAIPREDAPRAESVLLVARMASTPSGSTRPWAATAELWRRDRGAEDEFESFTLDAALRLADGRLALLVAGHDIALLARGGDGRWATLWERPLPEECGAGS